MEGFVEGGAKEVVDVAEHMITEHVEQTYARADFLETVHLVWKDFLHFVHITGFALLVSFL